MKSQLTNLLLLLLVCSLFGACAETPKPKIKTSVDRVIMIAGKPVNQRFETDGWINL